MYQGHVSKVYYDDQIWLSTYVQSVQWTWAAVTFAGFITSGVTIIKMLGLGIAFAILLDATVVRALLVPALMRLFGELNWWAPKWMLKLQRRAKLDH